MQIRQRKLNARLLLMKAEPIRKLGFSKGKMINLKSLLFSYNQAILAPLGII